MKPRLLVIVFLLLLPCLSSCSQQGSELIDETHRAGGHGTQLPGLPPLPEDRIASEPYDNRINGSDFIDSTGPPRVQVSNEVAILQSNAFVTAWAIWQFPPTNDALLEVSPELVLGPEDSGYIGISNYETGRWDFIAAADGVQTINVDLFKHSSPAKNVYIAVVATRGSKIIANSLTTTVNKLGWHVFPVVTEGDVGRQCRIAEVDGRPAIISRRYLSPTTAELVYAYSLTELGLYPEDWFSIAINDSPAGGSNPDLALIGGNPAVSYQDGDSLTLKYVRSSTVHGKAPANWAAAVEVDNDFRAGEGSSLAEVDGRPAIAYQVAGSFDELRYAYSDSADGMDGADWHERAIESGGDTGYYPQLMVVGGNPAIGYYDYANDRVSYLRSTSVLGDGPVDWIQYVNLLQGGGSASLLSPVGLLWADGHPGLIHVTATDALNWQSCFTSTTGESKPDWDNKAAVNSAGNLQYFGAAAIVGGFPAAAYRDGDTDDVWISRSTAANGNETLGDWPASMVFENDDDSNAFDIDMAEVAGRPVVCFYRNSMDSTHDDLYYAVLLD
ncbi:hypothetical protein KDL29_12250 [bacterium]|nr:hypothetical protein [bacterium]